MKPRVPYLWQGGGFEQCYNAQAAVAADRRAVPTGVGVNFGPVQRYHAHLQHAHFTRQSQHPHGQRLDLLQKSPPECGDGVVIGMIIRRDEPGRHGIVCRPFQLAAGKHAGGLI
jgi:hypothetical protein